MIRYYSKRIQIKNSFYFFLENRDSIAFGLTLQKTGRVSNLTHPVHITYKNVDLYTKLIDMNVSLQGQLKFLTTHLNKS